MKIPVHLTRRPEVGQTGLSLNGDFTMVGVFNGANGLPCMILVDWKDGKVLTTPMAGHDVISLEPSDQVQATEIPQGMGMADWEKYQSLLYLGNMLGLHNGSKAAAAGKSDISIATLYRKLKQGKSVATKFGLAIPELAAKALRSQQDSVNADNRSDGDLELS